MAEDVLTLIDYLDWTGERQLHIVGISLGGMISLGQWRAPLPHLILDLKNTHIIIVEISELATRIPQRIASLTLFVTTAGNTPRPFGNFAPVRLPLLKYAWADWRSKSHLFQRKGTRNLIRYIFHPTPFIREKGRLNRPFAFFFFFIFIA